MLRNHISITRDCAVAASTQSDKEEIVGTSQHREFAVVDIHELHQSGHVRICLLYTSTPELVHEFIEKIVVSAPEYKDDKRCQKVEIYYNGVGIVREPTAEEMEEYFEEHIRRKPFLKAKTA